MSLCTWLCSGAAAVKIRLQIQALEQGAARQQRSVFLGAWPAHWVEWRSEGSNLHRTQHVHLPSLNAPRLDWHPCSRMRLPTMCCRATFDTDNIDIGPERRAFLDHRLSRVWEFNGEVGLCAQTPTLPPPAHLLALCRPVLHAGTTVTPGCLL